MRHIVILILVLSALGYFVAHGGNFASHSAPSSRLTYANVTSIKTVDLCGVPTPDGKPVKIGMLASIADFRLMPKGFVRQLGLADFGKRHGKDRILLVFEGIPVELGNLSCFLGDGLHPEGFARQQAVKSFWQFSSILHARLNLLWLFRSHGRPRTPKKSSGFQIIVRG